MLRRWAWLIRLAVVSSYAFVGVLAVRLAWGAIAERRWHAKLDELRSRGEPMSLEELLTQSPGAGDETLERIEAALPLVTRFGEFDAIRLDSHATQELREQAASVLADNRPALAALAAALDGAAHQSLAAATRPTSDPARRSAHAAELMGIAALDAALRGDAEAALHWIELEIKLGDALHGAPPTLLSHVRAEQIESRALDALESVLACLSRTDLSAADAAVRRLIAVLWSDDRPRSRWRRAWRGEWLHMERQMRTNPLYASTDRWLMQPGFVADRSRLREYFDRVISLADAPSWESVREHQPRIGVAESHVGRAAELLTVLCAPAFEWSRLFGVIAHRRLAATAIALRLYQRDHGYWPANLAGLSPAYLPVAPLDPLAEGGALLRWYPDADPPVLEAGGAPAAKRSVDATPVIVFRVGER